MSHGSPPSPEIALFASAGAPRPPAGRIRFDRSLRSSVLAVRASSHSEALGARDVTTHFGPAVSAKKGLVNRASGCLVAAAGLRPNWPTVLFAAADLRSDGPTVLFAAADLRSDWPTVLFAAADLRSDWPTAPFNLAAAG